MSTEKPETGINNMDPYEREKIESLLSDARELVVTIENYLAAVDHCSEKGIRLDDREIMEVSDLSKSREDIRKATTPFTNGGVKITGDLPPEIYSELLEKRGYHDFAKKIRDRIRRV